MTASAVAGFVVLYIFGIVINIVAAGTVYEDHDEKLGARLGLMTPVWPLTAVYGLYMLARFLWDKAEIDLGKVKK